MARCPLRTALLRVVLLAPLLLGLPAGPAVGSPWQKIAAEGEDDPDGRPYGALILAPVVANDGAVSFADVPSDPLTNPPRYSLWRWSAAVGVEPLETFVTPPSPAIGWVRPELFSDASGNLAWREGFRVWPVDCGVEETSTQARERLYELPRGGEPALVGATGATAPGLPAPWIARLLWRRIVAMRRGAIVYPFPPPEIDPDGALSFAARIADDPCFADSNELPEAVFAPDARGATALVVREGDPLPGPGDAIVRRLLDFERLAEPAPALLVLVAADEEQADVALLRWTSAGGLERLARVAEPSAFFGGATLVMLEGLTGRIGGRVALFATRAAGEGEPGDPERTGIWTGDASGLEERWLLAGPVPGRPDGAVFDASPLLHPDGWNEWDEPLADRLLLNDAGQVAFLAAFRPAPEADRTLGLFAPGPDGGPRLRFALGDAAPGLGGKRITWVDPLHLSGDGTLLAFVLAETEALEEDAAWYLLPPAAPPRLLLRASDPIEIAPGDARSLPVRVIAHDDALTRLAVRLGQSPFEPEAIAVRAVPEPCVSAAGACALAALGLLASRPRARMPIQTGCRSEPPRAS